MSFVFGMFGKKKRKKQLKNQEPQIVYVQQGKDVAMSPSKKKGFVAVVWALILPILTNFVKQEGTKAAEKYGAELMEKYKDKLNLDKFLK